MHNAEERLETELRIRLTAALRTQGFGSEGIAKEVLYWLPPGFLDWYRDTYLAALSLNGLRSKSAGSRDGEAGKVGVDSKWKGKRVGAGAGGGGKRWVPPGWVIRDEQVLEKLGRVNAFLERIALSDGRLTDEKTGKVVSKRIAGRVKLVCDECGRFMRTEWRRCPYHEV